MERKKNASAATRARTDTRQHRGDSKRVRRTALHSFHHDKIEVTARELRDGKQLKVESYTRAAMPHLNISEEVDLVANSAHAERKAHAPQEPKMNVRQARALS